MRENAGRAKPVRNWDEAIAQFRRNFVYFYPGLSDADWRKLVQRGYRENEQGIPELDVDLNVGEAARKLKPKTDDFWQMFDTLSDTPVVLLHFPAAGYGLCLFMKRPEPLSRMPHDPRSA